MNIRMLYNDYIKLKEQNKKFEDLEFSFYSILVNLNNDEKYEFDKWDLEDEITQLPDYKNCTSEQIRECHLNRRYFNYYEYNEFVSVYYMNVSPIEKNYLKLYFSVSNSLKKEFMVKYGIFVKENQIRGTYKIRKNKQANDLVTVRVYNLKHFSKVFEFVKKVF